jgi:hypothetical protein
MALALTRALTAAAVLSHNVVQFQAGTAPALIVSTVLRRKPTLLRGISSVETPLCIYSRLVDGASKGPNTAGSGCIISSIGAACVSGCLVYLRARAQPYKSSFLTLLWSH